METIFNRNLMENHPSEKFIEAKKKVDKIKGFYKHVAVYVVINILLIIAKTSILNYFINEGNKDPGFLSWLKMNIWVTPVLWAIGLVIHGLVVFKFQNITFKNFKPNVLKNWEEKRMQQYMDQDNTL